MKKTFRTVRNVFTWMIVILAIGIVIFTVISVTVYNRRDINLFGYRAYIVLSDSMSATDFSAGDLVLVRKVDPSTLEEGDIIAFRRRTMGTEDEVVTHKIRERVTDSYGNPGFITYGTTTGKDDEGIVSYGAVLGRYERHLPGVGKIFRFIKTTPGYILCIFIPFLILILIEFINCIRLFQQYKREQMEEIEAERKKMEEEHEETKRMLRELQSQLAEMKAKEKENGLQENSTQIK